jgi:hypothetical protein
MKRITLLLTVALVMALMLALAGPALATIHEVAKMECASETAQENENSTVRTQDPPGLTGGSQANNFGRPVLAVTPEGQPLFPGAPPGLVGTNPSAEGASGNALKIPEGC